MFLTTALLLLLLLATASSAANCSCSSTTTTTPIVTDPAHNLTYHGILTANATVEKFLNIRYGSAARFANPQLVYADAGSVVDATAQGPVCPQPATDGVYPWYTASTWFSEDCLRLKVARPSGTQAGDALPVMVYIYGGSLLYGEINEPANEPDGLIVQSVENGLPVVFVAMNYRLNTFGFPVNDALIANNSVNLGFKDQRLALDWVQANIDLFGGDPNNVTIFGQSSGGLSVTMQILSHGGSQPKPFHRAIMESAALEPNLTSSLTSLAFDAVATQAGCTEPDSSSAVECLRDLSMEELWNITADVYADLGAQTGTSDFWFPVVDGDFLPASPSQLISDGNFTQMPVIIGWTHDDASGGVNLTIATAADTRDFIAGLYPSLSNTTLDTLLALYPTNDFAARAAISDSGLTAEYYRAAEIYRDLYYVCPSLYFGAAMASASAASPVYYYELNQTIYTPLANEVHTGLGVIHESEFPYLFANFSVYVPEFSDYVTIGAADEALLPQLSRSWSTFAAAGVPSLEDHNTLPGWTAGGTAALADSSLYVIGGPTPGMSSFGAGGDVPDIVAQNLATRCDFVNTPVVIEQLQY